MDEFSVKVRLRMLACAHARAHACGHASICGVGAPRRLPALHTLQALARVSADATLAPLPTPQVRREPLGVVGLVTPWNYPLLMATVSEQHHLAPAAQLTLRFAVVDCKVLAAAACWPPPTAQLCPPKRNTACPHPQWKVAPALAAGCCCVLKPSEVASVTCLELAALASEAGLPPGVFNVITGLGPEAGAPLW